MDGVATKIGAKSFVSKLSTADNKNHDYSFDYGNSHFVGLDWSIDSDNSGLTQDQINWLDQDLATAESRGLTHAFIFTHQPMYTVGSHCCTEATALVPVLNAHPIVSATFHGHEHTYAYTLLNSNRLPGLNRTIPQFVDGSVGARHDSCQPGRADKCVTEEGFISVEVADRNVTVKWNNPQGPVSSATVTFTKP